MEVHEPLENFRAEGWAFEEGLLDEKHCYAIAVHSDEPILDGSDVQRLSWGELLENARPYPPSYNQV